MAQVVIENPILNSPFAQPTRHFKFDDDGITNQIEESRRISAYFVPIAQPKKKGKQLVLDTDWTKDRVEENAFINRVRLRVAAWRDGHYPGVTRTTAALLAYWTDPERDRKLFFCQIEALETTIYLAEAAKKYGDAWIENDLRLANQEANPLLDRIAFKMATGSGKTVVMAMLIAWQALNKFANPQDARFSDSFLIITPGITIRDRLRVLLPNDSHNYYRERDVVPAYQMEKLGQARILITNFHAFLPRERVDAGKLTKGILAPGDPDRFKETPDQMVRRVCRELGTKKGIVVLNDEAHHCYRRRVAPDEPKLKGEDRRDAEKRNEEARIWISGVEAGALDIFRNDDGRGKWLSRPNTILVDSEQLESGDAMSAEFKQIAAREIDEFKADYRLRFPGRDADELTDEDLLREVMNTVGKPGMLGEHVKCVVSVSMLTEGWDANTVTHILGIRAFGTQLLCEQVVGRGLRRRSYSLNSDGRFEPEYAEVYGVPFSFIPCSGSHEGPQPGPDTTRVRALDDRRDCEMTFPRLVGYRYDVIDDDLNYEFTADSRLALSTADIPSMTENHPIVGEMSIHRLDDLKERREQEVAFLLAKMTLEKYFRQNGDKQTEKMESHKFESAVQAWRFPQLLEITRRWLAECVTLKDNTFKQMLLLIELAHDGADRIYQSILAGTAATKILKPIVQPYDTLGSMRWVDFDTIRPTWATRADKCHISHVVADTNSWEQKLAQTLEEMPEVVRYVKNQNLGFVIPYTLDGEERKYYPDFLVHIDDGHGPDNLLNVIIEVTGERKKDKAAKVATARNLWIPAVNNDGSFGRWEFVEVINPWDAQNLIRKQLVEYSAPAPETISC